MEKKLKSGFTTGTCAAAAARAAAFLLCSGRPVEQVRIITPRGQQADLKIRSSEKDENMARCMVQKDAGDDPDITDQALLCVSVKRLESGKNSWDEMWYKDKKYPGIALTGGNGIGVVTKPGLPCPVGSHAINPVPREMIFQEVFQVKEEWQEEHFLLVTVEIPNGRELAEKTFNPRLGILGGLSILGTTGIVEPMSQEALAASIRLEIHMKAVEGNCYLVLVPGNYGERFLRDEKGISINHAVRCSNFIGDAVRSAAREGFRRGLLAGHIGKLIKVAGGVENTHSMYGDRRMEILADCLREWIEKEGRSQEQRIKKELTERILVSNTTEEAMELLEKYHMHRKVGELAAERIRRQILLWTDGKLTMDVILFSSRLGTLGEAGNGWKEERGNLSDHSYCQIQERKKGRYESCSYQLYKSRG
ncbi:cobalt-precorrin-5B (C(1))-methyltransferase CbiD [Lachnospiraceae bacterium 62-35]